MKRAGSGTGCGALRVWLEGECMVEATLEIAKFFAREQCGQCPACRMETQTFVMALGQLAGGKGGRNSLQQMAKVAAYARGKGRCSLTAMAAAPVLSAVELFEADFAQHIQNGCCPEWDHGRRNDVCAGGGV